MAKDIWPALRQWADERLEAVAGELTQGQFTTLEQARERVGYLRALSELVAEMNRLTREGSGPTEEL